MSFLWVYKQFPVLQEDLDIYLGLQQFIVTTGSSELQPFTLHFQNNITTYLCINMAVCVCLSCRSAAEHHGRGRLQEAALCPAGPQLSASGRWATGWVLHWWCFHRPLLWCPGHCAEVRGITDSPLPQHVSFDFQLLSDQKKCVVNM